MLKLLSISDDAWCLNKFDHDTGKIESFLADNGLHGLELMKWQNPQPNPIPPGKVIGRHLVFYPMWLDFWKSDREALLRHFGNEENCFQYYRAKSKDEWLENYRRDLRDASDMGVQYVVFHVTHITVEDTYSHSFPYSDGEVIESFIGLMNEILRGLNIRYTLLFENHWFPGLTFLNKHMTERLLDGVDYPDKGLVLDIGHLMNTNMQLKSEQEAVPYILGVLDSLDTVKQHIRAIHLNSSITDESVREALRNDTFDPRDSFDDRLIAAMRHVCKMDSHKPFEHPNIKKVIDAVQPQFLVYELASDSFEELLRVVQTQNKAIRQSF
ncbi:MAG: TIM barrel protein [Bacillota bacterium]